MNLPTRFCFVGGGWCKCPKGSWRRGDILLFSHLRPIMMMMSSSCHHDDGLLLCILLHFAAF